MDAIESMETCENNSINAEVPETTGTHEETTNLLDSHAIENNGKSISIRSRTFNVFIISKFQNTS